MEMLFAVLGGIVLGIGVYFLLPDKGRYGSAVLPAIAGAVTAMAWAGLTWAGWAFDAGWIWVVSLLAGPLAAGLAGVLLARTRAASDERMFEALSKP